MPKREVITGNDGDIFVVAARPLIDSKLQDDIERSLDAETYAFHDCTEVHFFGKREEKPYELRDRMIQILSDAGDEVSILDQHVEVINGHSLFEIARVNSV